MSKRKLDLFIPITKVDEENRLVYGTLAAEEIDNSGEIFDYESSKPNFEKWSDGQFEASGGLSKGNVRAMHASKAAGKLTDISYDDDTKIIEGCAKVVDDNEWEKVLEGVYTGFSVGGRYAKRWQDNGNTRYTAEPVEVSLVDKPCIKSAKFAGLSKTFLLCKADGTDEEREFHVDDESIFKKSDEGVAMYVPTNDEILPVAQSLAKADGKTDADWLDYSDAARDQIVAEHEGTTVEKADGAMEHTDEDCQKADCPDCAEKATKADVGEAAPVAAESGEDTDTGGDGPTGELSATDGSAAGDDVTKGDKVTPPGVHQTWTASDGKTFEKKADCVAHEDTLTKAAAPASLSESLDSALATVGALAKGEAVIDEPVAEVVVEEPLGKSVDVQLTELADFISGPDLRKGLYDVSYFTGVLRSASYVYTCARNESAREGDGSSVPATVLEGIEKLAQALIDMATEEVGEMLTELRTAGESSDAYIYPDCCYLAAGTMGLEKADADNWFGECLAKYDARGPRPVQTEAVETDAVGDMAKAAGFDTADAFITDLKKRAEELDEIKPKVEALTKFIDTIKASPRPAAPTTAVVEKTIDANRAGGGNGGGDTPMAKAEAALAGMSPEEISRLAIKMSHASGGRTLSLPQ